MVIRVTKIMCNDHNGEEVLVEDITNWMDSEGEEEDT
jgi:hypothetical protein